MAHTRAVVSADVHPHDGINLRLAVWITEHVGTMECAYIFAGIGIGSLVGYLTGNMLLAVSCGATSSYLLQLALLPVIMVGQRVQSRHADAMSLQTFETNQRIERKLDKLLQAQGLTVD